MTHSVQSGKLEAIQLQLKIEGESILHQINFKIERGEVLAITGASGSGKTMLGKVLVGRQQVSSGTLNFLGIERRLMVDQQDHFIAFSGRRSMHHSQRYESVGMENVPTVHEFLQQVVAENTHDNKSEEVLEVLTELEIAHLQHQKILELSNGERKRTQLAVALLQQPDLLVLDQPFVGLDFHSQAKLKQLLTRLKESGICVVMMVDSQHISAPVDWVLELKNGTVNQFVRQKEYQSKIEIQSKSRIDPLILDLLPDASEAFDDMVVMKKVNVTLSGKPILKAIDWQVRRGEQWALLGPNGSGKSTLLSLVTADNPQGYSNHLVLFDRQRGSGESIWDIKKRIGFVSPELHLYFLRGAGIFNTIPGLKNSKSEVYSSLACQDVVTSGFQDEVGFSSPATDHQLKTTQRWLQMLGLAHLQKRLFVHTSLGEQRVVLLVRALVKSPQLLVLDEPCQGLDQQQASKFIGLLEQICSHLNTTMIYVTHQKEEIPECVTHLLQLENGQVKSQGAFDRSRFEWNH